MSSNQKEKQQDDLSVLRNRAQKKIIPVETLQSYLRKTKQTSQFDFVISRDSDSSSVASESDRESDYGNTSTVHHHQQQHFHSQSTVNVSSRQKNSLVSVARPSILSKEASKNSYRGFLNLAILILVVSHSRLMLENLQKYGLLINTPEHVVTFLRDQSVWPSVVMILSLNIWVFATYIVEKILSIHVEGILKKYSPSFSKEKKVQKPSFSNWLETFMVCIHYASIGSLLFVPVFFIYTVKPHPAAGIIIMMLMTITFMKLISYAVINYGLRHDLIYSLGISTIENEKKSSSNGSSYPGTGNRSAPLKYPHNITVRNILYFMWAPTLVYEEIFPRTKKIRWGFLIRRIFEFLLFCFLIIFMVEQYILPIVKNAKTAMLSNDPVGIMERMMKLTVPNIIVWLMGFYTFFHLYLNIISEILCFGDRLFYMDFWNATSMDYFWRTWNLPVHKWLVVHVYLPLITRKWSQNVASFMVFFVSAIFHEIVISVPFQTIECLAFFAMMSQMPFCFITRKYTRGKQIGNVVFWLSFTFGQANCVLFYYYNFQKKLITP